MTAGARPYDLFLRNEANLEFVQSGGRDPSALLRLQNPPPAPWRILPGVVFIVVLAYIVAKALEASGARTVPLLAFLGFMLIVAAGLMAWLTVQAIRFPGRMRRLRELGSIVYGRVESADWHTVWGDDGTHQDVLSIDYTFDVDGRTHAETIRLGRDQAAFGYAPPSGFRVAILYVNDRLWELL